MMNERQNKHGRRSLMILSLNAALLLGVGLILPLRSANAAPVTTTISVQDSGGFTPQAQVTVFNAQNGQQLANGLTDLGTGLFTFRSNNGTDLIVVVHSSSGYLAAARVRPGDFRTIVAFQGETAARHFAVTDTAQNALVAMGTEVISLSQNQKIQEMSFPVPSGSTSNVDLSKAMVAVVEWDTFEQVGRGHLDKEGQFTFDLPEGTESGVFLATVWGDEGSITVLRIKRNDPSIDGWLMTPAGS